MTRVRVQTSDHRASAHYPIMGDDYYIVICRADRIGRRTPPYVLATRRVFDTPAAAATYAATVSPSRAAIVVAGRFHQLRIGGAE